MPGPNVTGELTAIANARGNLDSLERATEKLRVQRSSLRARRAAAAQTGNQTQADRLRQAVDRIDLDLTRRRNDRRTLLDQIGTLSDRFLVARTPEDLVTTLDGTHPVAMLPVRIETRFETATKLRVRIFPDQLHIDAHDPALTAEETDSAHQYWQARWARGLHDTDAAQEAWRTLTAQFRPGRAAWLVAATTPNNTPPDGAPAFPNVPLRASTWSKAPAARALPDRFCVVGLRKQGGQWVQRFRRWGKHVPDELAAAPAPNEMSAPAADGQLPVDEGTRWLSDPARAEDQGVLIEVDDPALAGGVDRLVVLGVDWTQSPDAAATTLQSLLRAQAYAGHFAFVPQGTPTNNTNSDRSGVTSDPAREAAALDPTAPPLHGDEWSAGVRLAAALGLPADAFDDVPGAELREHAWASSLADALWRGTAGFYLTDMLDPLAADPKTDADLREFTRRHVFAAGPIPALRVGFQPYGVVPVVAARRYDPGADPTAALVHRVATVLRDIVTPAIGSVPHLQRAGEGQQDVDTVLLALLQRSPVPCTFRFRPMTGPIQRKNLSVRWDLINAWQRTWTSAMWSGLGVSQSTRLQELTLGKSHPLPVPLVRKPGVADPTGYLTEIADLTLDPNGRKALNLRENSIALLEALAAASAVLELDRTALQATREWLNLDLGQLATLPALRKLSVVTPDLVRVEAAPAVPKQPLDFSSGRQLADAVIPIISDLPIGEVVTTTFAREARRLPLLLTKPQHAFHGLARNQDALRTLATAPADQLEWAFRGYLDLFSTRLDAWFTALATQRLTRQRTGAPTGVHVGCWGFVEDLRRDVGAAAESVGFVHAPSLTHAASAALLRNGRLANRDAADIFDLQVTSDRVRIALWLLEGVNQGQRLAALLGYRLERTLRESGLTMMKYQMPLRRTAPLRGPQEDPATPVEVLAARDVVDGVTLLDRWRRGPDAVLADIAKQAKVATIPAADAKRLRAVIDETYAAYDAVSDLLVAEGVHQATVGNLDRSGAALAAHDRHGRAPDLDFVSSPRSGHTVAHRVALVAQGTAAPGWPQDPRSRAEPLLNAWVASLLGRPGDWKLDARLRVDETSTTALTTISLADLGLSPLATVLAAQRTGQGRPSELTQRIALVFATQTAATPEAIVELLPGSHEHGLAALTTLCEWAATVCGGAPLTADDLAAGSDVRPGHTATGTVDVADLANRVTAARAALKTVRTALKNASTTIQRAKALLNAAPFVGPDAVPKFPANHPNAAAELGDQIVVITAKLAAVNKAVTDAAAVALPDLTAPGGPEQVAARHTEVLRILLGTGQPVLPRWTMAEKREVAASLAGRADLLAGDAAAPAAWLHRSALVRPGLDAFSGLLQHLEADGVDVPGQLSVVQLPHRPGAAWLALPFGTAGVPPHGSVGVVVHSWQPFTPARPFAGVVVDAWTETIPAEVEDTAVTFHYDAPGSRAPQAVVLAVHPAPQPDTWTFDLLLDTVLEAADLAQLRTLSSAELAALGSFLPALYLPDDYTRDVPALPLKDLIAKAFAAGHRQQFPDVLGKA